MRFSPSWLPVCAVRRNAEAAPVAERRCSQLCSRFERAVVCNDAPDEFDHVWRVPLGRPDEPADLASLSVDDECRGDAEYTELPRRAARTVEIYSELFDTHLGEELAHGIDRTIHRQRRDFEIGAAECGIQSVEGGHLLTARHAPSRPDIEQHDLAAEIGQASRLTLVVAELDRGERFGCVVDNPIR